jgi:hypothetical protein
MQIITKELTTVQIVKKRFADKKETLKDCFSIKLSDFRQFAISIEDKWNHGESWDKLNSVWNGRSSDIELCEIIEQYEESLIA